MNKDEQNKQPDDETLYRLTPKGFLVYHLGEQVGEPLWEELVKFCQSQLDYDEARGIPAIILHEGGIVTTVQKDDEETD